MPFRLRLRHAVIGALFAVLMVPTAASALEFSPTLDVSLGAGAEGRTGDSAAPRVDLLLERSFNEVAMRNTDIDIPLDWRVNARANLARCSKSQLGSSLYDEAIDKYGEWSADQTDIVDILQDLDPATITDNCIEGTDAGVINATISCEVQGEDADTNEICDYVDLPEIKLTGVARVMNAKEFFREHDDWREEFVGSKEYLEAQCEQCLPVVINLVVQIPPLPVPDDAGPGTVKTIEKYNELFAGKTFAVVPTALYAVPDLYNIRVSMRNVPWELQVGMTALGVSFYEGPADMMYDLDTNGTAEGGDPSGKSIGLLRTPPGRCDKTHVFNAYIESWADPTANNATKTTNVPDDVTVDGCGQAAETFAPTLDYNFSTTQANASPTATIKMHRGGEMSYMTGMEMGLPWYTYGSPIAVQPVCTPNTAAKTAEEVCPAATRIGSVSMQARLFENEGYIPVEGIVYLGSPDTPFDLAKIIVGARMPPIGGNGMAILSGGMQLVGDNLNQIVTKMNGLMEEFSINDVVFTLEGATGRDRGAPLLMLPSTCAESQFDVNLTSEFAGVNSKLSKPFKATGCENLSYDPQTSVTLASIEPGSKPDMDVEMTQTFGDAATKKTEVFIPAGVEINQKSTIKPCSSDEAASHSCPDSAKIGQASIETPLLNERLDAKLFLAKPPADDKLTVMQIIAEIKGPAGLQAQLKGKMGKNPNGPGFLMAFDGMPPFPFVKMSMKAYGGGNGLVIVPKRCGQHVFKTVLTSHTERSVTRETAIDVHGATCAPKLSARFDPANAGGPTEISLAVRPNDGDGYSAIKRAVFDLGQGQSGLKIAGTSKKAKRGKKKKARRGKHRSSKATVARKRRSKRKRRKGGKKLSKQIGVVTLTPQKGQQLTAQLQSQGRKGKVGLKRRGAIGVMSNISVELVGSKLIVTNLPQTPMRELNITLKSGKNFKLSTPSRPGAVTVAGTYLLANGKEMSSSSRVNIGPKSKKTKKRKKKGKKKKGK